MKPSVQRSGRRDGERKGKGTKIQMRRREQKGRAEEEQGKRKKRNNNPK